MNHANEHAAESHDHVHQHVVPLSLLAGVLAALLVLTGLTVYTARAMHFGEWNLVIAIVIACVKGTLVVLYFMHMRWEKMFNAIALITALVFVTLFISVSALDSFAYDSQVEAYRDANPARLQQNVLTNARERAPEHKAADHAAPAAEPAPPAEPARDSEPHAG